jgi:hypothetical protein
MKDTFIEYIEKEMGDELMISLSIGEIQKDWNMSFKDVLGCISYLNKYHIKPHPDHDWHIVIVDKIKAHAIAERKKDKVSRR